MIKYAVSGAIFQIALVGQVVLRNIDQRYDESGLGFPEQLSVGDS